MIQEEARDMKEIGHDFECRNVIMYSLAPENLTGDGAWAEVYRISPIDAVHVYSEKDDTRRANELAGTVLMDFGAFMDEGRRENDNGPIEEFNLARTSSVSPILKMVWRNANIYLCLALLMFGVLALPLHATSGADVTNFPEVVSPGQSITILGSFDPLAQGGAVIRIYVVGTSVVQSTVSGQVGEKSITTKIPENIKPGRYYVTVDCGDVKDKLVTGELRVTASAVQFDGVHPQTTFASKNGRFNFDVIGRNFSETPEDNQIFASGQGPIVKSWSKTEAGCTGGASVPLPCLWVESKEILHVVGYQGEHYQGPLFLSLSVGGGTRSAEKSLILSRMSETGVLFFSILVFSVLGFAVYRLVARGVRDTTIGGIHYSPFYSFFIDKETNSYSLSRFQLLLFSSVFVFAYFYVFLCRWLVQWQFVLPDIPSSLSGILAISAGTAIAAAGATSARGSKGAGPLQPSAADFISTGGQVVPERFQFFVWSLVACFGFLALLLSQNSATITEFPQIPQGLLYVMGVSAVGYLGGKLTRSPGPVIRNIAWDKGKQVITVQGENLSKDADFFVDDQKLPIDPKATESLVVPTPQEQATDKTFCSQLKITINPIAGLDLGAGDHLFRLENRDGQFAEIRFTASSPEIKAVTMTDRNSEGTQSTNLRPGSEASVITVKGAGFKPGTSGRWTPANAKEPIDLPASAVEFVDPQTLKITLVVGEAGTASLMLSTPTGFSITSAVTVAE